MPSGVRQSNNQKKSINKVVLRDPHFEEDDETGLTSSIAAEPVLAAILSRVASASSLPISSSATTLPSSAEGVIARWDDWYPANY
jgi:succinylarginine dihydrolase